MTEDKGSTIEMGPRGEGVDFRRAGSLFLVLGIVQLSLGAVAVIASVATLYLDTVTGVLFGFLALAAGLAQIVSGCWAGRWSGYLLHLLIGVLYAVIGYLIADARVESTLELTLVLAAFLIAGGLFRIVGALVLRFEASSWVLLGGAVSLLLGVMVNEQWPPTGPLVVGLFLGIDIVLNGVAWVMLAVVLGLRQRENFEG